MSDEIKVTAQQNIYDALLENKRAGDNKTEDTQKLNSVFAQLTTNSDGVSIDKFVDSIYSEYNTKGTPSNEEKEALTKVVAEIASMNDNDNGLSKLDVGMFNFKNEVFDAVFGENKVSSKTSQKLDEMLSDLIDKNNSNGINAKEFYLAICDALGIEAKDFENDSDTLLNLIKEIASEDSNSSTINSLDFENYAVDSIANTVLEATKETKIDTDSSSLKSPKEVFKGNLADSRVEIHDNQYTLKTQDWTYENQNDMNVLNTLSKITQGIYGVDFYSEEGQKIYKEIKELNPGFVDEEWNKNHPDKDGWMIQCGNSIILPNPNYSDKDGKIKPTEVPESFKGEYSNKVYKNDNDKYVIKTEKYSTGKDGELSTTANIIKAIYGYDYNSKEGQKIFESLKINNPGFFKDGKGENIDSNKELLLVNADKVLAKDEAISSKFKGENSGKLIYTDKDNNNVVNADKNSTTTNTLENILKSVYGMDVNDSSSIKANEAKKYLEALKESNKNNIDKDGKIKDFSIPIILPDPNKIEDNDGGKKENTAQNNHTEKYATYYDNLKYLNYYEKYEGTPFFDKIIETNSSKNPAIARVLRDNSGNPISCYAIGNEYYLKETGEKYNPSK